MLFHNTNPQSLRLQTPGLQSQNGGSGSSLAPFVAHALKMQDANHRGLQKRQGAEEQPLVCGPISSLS